MSVSEVLRHIECWGTDRRRKAAWCVIVALTIATAAIGFTGATATAAVPGTIFGSAVPKHPAEPDTQNVELGVQFKVAVAGQVAAVRFYKSTANTGTHIGRLYGPTGTRLAAVTFTLETASGWQQAKFAAPVSVTAGSTYTASYVAPRGQYSNDQNYPWPKVSGDLTGTRGTYRYGGGYPTATWQGSNYGVDVVFAPTTTTSGGSSVVSTAPSSTVPTTAASSSPPASSSPAPTSPTTTATTPPPGGWPGANNTGVPTGTTLTPSGTVTANTPGQVIDSLDINGGIIIQAPNVVVKNSRINGGGTWQCIYIVSGSATIQDSEITGGCENGIAFDNWTALRVNIHSTTSDGVKLGDNVLLQDSWIHDLTPAPGAHADGGQMESGITNLVIRHNNIDMGNPNYSPNSALFISPDLGPSSAGPVTIDNNKLNGGNYTLFCVDGNNGQYHVSNINITNNRFGRTYQYGPSDVNVPITQSGNVWDDTGARLAL